MTSLAPLKSPFELYAVDEDGCMWKANTVMEAKNGFYKKLTPNKSSKKDNALYRVRKDKITYEFNQQTNRELQEKTIARILISKAKYLKQVIDNLNKAAARTAK